MKAGQIRCPTCGLGFRDIELSYDMAPGSCTESRVFGFCQSGHPLQVRLTSQALEVVAGDKERPPPGARCANCGLQGHLLQHCRETWP